MLKTTGFTCSSDLAVAFKNKGSHQIRGFLERNSLAKVSDDETEYTDDEIVDGKDSRTEAVDAKNGEQQLDFVIADDNGDSLRIIKALEKNAAADKTKEKPAV